MIDTTPFFILSDESLTIFRDGKLASTTSEVSSWDDIKAALAAKRWDDVFDLIDQATAVAEYTSTVDGVEVRDGNVYWNGELMTGVLVDRILSMRAEGFDIAPMTAFLANLQQNPSYSSREQLYRFLEANRLPITGDGCFMAYKRIRNDWKDVYSGKINNRIGETPSMPREKVDDDPNRTCSQGLHVCSLEYLKSYSGQKLVGVKVNPRDVVSVPTDYNNSKMRVSAYTVLEELPMDLVRGTQDFWGSTVVHNECNEEEDIGDLPYVLESTLTDEWWDGMEWNSCLEDAKRFRTELDAERYAEQPGNAIGRHYKVSEYVYCESWAEPCD